MTSSLYLSFLLILVLSFKDLVEPLSFQPDRCSLSRRHFLSSTCLAPFILIGALDLEKAEAVPEVKYLQNVEQFPLPVQVTLGTCCHTGVVTQRQVQEAIRIGYRTIDTASHYENEGDIASAIQSEILKSEGTLQRGDIRIVTKVWFDQMGYEKTLAALNESLINIGDYIDLALIHFPGTIDSIQSPKANQKLRASTWLALEEAYKSGTVKSIGLSNFDSRHLKTFLPSCSISPQVNQIEFHPYFQQWELVERCWKVGMQIMSFCPFAHGDLPVLRDTNIMQIAKKHRKSTAQVIIRWLAQEGITPVPKSLNPHHLRENIDVYDFELSEDEMNIMRSLDRNQRVGFDPNLIA